MDSGQGPGTSKNWRQRQKGKSSAPRQKEHPSNSTRHPTFNRESNKRNSKFLGFITLQKLSENDSREIFLELNTKKEAFTELLQNPIERLDVYFLILAIVKKVCNSSCDQLKLQLLLDICNSNFIKNLNIYLMELPYVERKRDNSMYWNNQELFWENLTALLESIMHISPTTALNKCRSLIDVASKYCIESLKEKHGFDLPEECNLRLHKLRNSITDLDKIKEEKKTTRDSQQIVIEEGEPPLSFREITILPTEKDLLEERPFLRPNIIDGAYSDVEHYLDVQFRLLREDCFGPIREGILQYLQNSTRRKYDNIRVYRNVTFAEPYVSPVKFGHIIQLDPKVSKGFEKIKWAYNKRLLFGALLLLTKDNCKSFIVATVLDREPKYLCKGKIPVSIMSKDVNLDIDYNQDIYLMIESDVYFEPYYHVLKVLQDPAFSRDLPMKKYIVDVEPTSKVPPYFAEYDLHSMLSSAEKKMRLNESQYEAFKLALTHEFAVIQGPPGTGKTYVGVKIAKVLLKIVKKPGCLLLIICYTNHALDQFLEALLNITDAIVRFGGQSRLEVMDKLNMNTIRKKNRSKFTSMFYDTKNKLKESVCKLKQLQNNITSLETGIVDFNVMMNLVRRSKDTCNSILQCYHVGKNAKSNELLCMWLFQKVKYDINKPVTSNIASLKEELANTQMDKNGDDRRNENEIDSDIDFDDISKCSDICVFSFKNCYEKLIHLLERYNKSEGVESYDLRLEIIKQETLIETFKEMKSRWDQDENQNEDINSRYPSKMPVYNRWKVYFQWATILKQHLSEDVKPVQDAARAANIEYEEAKMLLDLSLIKECKIVGMTTSGAARMRKFIKELAPPIVIVEEAAEVLEQHIVASLQNTCEHLILIGDHQQLRPSAAHMELARNYNIEVSLFERMINNNIHSRRLSVQHRMRPEIAALISPHIYPELQNDSSVETFPNVRGISKNLFFFTHDHSEENASDSTSKMNPKEAEIVLRLANYIMQQGYKPQDVTILSAYTAQMFYLKKEKQKYIHLKDVKITVVDNYQGEESKIIILSLVRNNTENKIGFLGTANRICVALSRAREGFYIFGNINMLKNQSELWKKINGTLEQNNAVGRALELKCENHPDQIINIMSEEDFDKAPEGGCLQKCNFNLPCSHPCPQICHAYNRNHESIACIEKCERILCDLQHVCPLNCAVMCKPCSVSINKLLPCGHKEDVMCHIEPNDVKCNKIVTVTLPSCGHEAQKACYVHVRYVMCPVPCEARLNCGHVCARTCHTEHDTEHELNVCEKPCTKLKKGCTFTSTEDNRDHQCQNKCYETCDECKVEVVKKRDTCKHTMRVPCSVDINAIKCIQNCARILSCNHHCKRKCFEPCGGCTQMVVKKVPGCGHTIRIECSIEPTEDMCRSQCQRMLPCGHQCRKQCNYPCDVTSCDQLTDVKMKAPCGHEVILPCKFAVGGKMDEDTLLSICKYPCEAILGCGHPCKGSCSLCWQGRLHEPCASKCDKDIICGHRCVEPCNEICPPCDKPCEVRCPHSKCNNKCGSPCTSCKERCTRQCQHGRCKKLCGQPCSIPACSQPCPKLQACGHPCRGLCGHPCPNACKQCRPNEYPKDFLNEDYEDDAKLVLLEDCGHIMEVEELDTWMSSKTEIIGIKTCPLCRKPIVKSYRYKDLINQMLKNYINPIKEKVYGKQVEIKNKRKELLDKLETFQQNHKVIPSESKSWTNAFLAIKIYIKRSKRSSLMQIDMNFIYLNILEILSEKFNEYLRINTTIFKAELQNQMNNLCKHLVKNVKKINYQQQQDIQNELNRVHAIIQFAKLLHHPAYQYVKDSPGVMKAYENAKKAILGLDIFNLNNSMKHLKLLQEEIKLNDVIVDKQQRDMIIKAIGLKAGHWFKCPNGHFYCIGECGGAMQVSKCPDCGESIGGTQHTLLSNNRHAKEFDGSQFPAWSEEYNNIANFQLD